MSRVAQMTHHVSIGHALHQSLNLEQMTESTEQKACFGSRSTPSSCSVDDTLPKSVRGAPPELRRIIRKRQNSESAKRCRQRRKVEEARTVEEMMTQAAKVERLEAVVQHLAERLHQTQTLIAALTSTPSSPAGPQAGCANGHPQCNGAECVLCVRSIQNSSPRLATTMISSRLENGSVGSSQMQNMAMAQVQTGGFEKHTQELQMALGARTMDNGEVLTNKSGWQ